jgi:hypothetical protein
MKFNRRHFSSFLLLLLVGGQLLLASTFVFFNPEYADPVNIVLIEEVDETSNSPIEEFDESNNESLLEEIIDEDEKMLSLHVFDEFSTNRFSRLRSSLNYHLLTYKPPFSPPELNLN